jgi:hypothetical protein
LFIALIPITSDHHSQRNYHLDQATGLSLALGISRMGVEVVRPILGLFIPNPQFYMVFGDYNPQICSIFGDYD